MNILGHELTTEQMPDGWVICERCIDGVLNIVTRDKFASERAAKRQLQQLNDQLIAGRDAHTLAYLFSFKS